MSEKMKEELEMDQLNTRKSILVATYETSSFILLRYPYICAVLLMVTTAEEFANKTLGRNHVTIIYINLALFFIAATIMAFDMFGGKRYFAVVTVFQFVYLSYHEYMKPYTEQVTFRLITRNLAVIGCFISVAGGIAKNKGTGDRNKFLLSSGRQLIGTYALLSAMFIWNGPQEFQFYSNSLPGDQISTMVIISLLIITAVAIYSGYEVVLFSKLLALLLLFVTVVIDMNVKRWESDVKLRQWIVYTIASRHIPVIATLLLIRKGYF